MIPHVHVAKTINKDGRVTCIIDFEFAIFANGQNGKFMKYKSLQKYDLCGISFSC